MATKEEQEARERADAEMNAKFEKIADGLKGIADRLDSAHARMDAMEQARKDADTAKEEEKKQAEREKAEGEKEKAATDRKDKARKDARKDKFGARKDGESEEEYKGRHDADETAMCDALEKGGTHTKDEARKDAAECRKDAEEEEKKEVERKDRARKDAEEHARKDATTATLSAENAELKKSLAELTGIVAEMRRETPAEERDALAKAQFRADSVAAMFGERAPAPITGETSLSYRRRALKPFLKHSAQFKDARLDSADSSLLGMLEDVVYRDAADASRADTTGTVGILVPSVSYDEAGRKITKFHGDPMAWMQQFMGGSYPVGKINRNPKPAA